MNLRVGPIAEWAGLEEFIDVPVRGYSTGMKARLGFGVATDVKPDVLLIDEVLAVGDLEFQRQCMGQMREVTGRGRTINNK